MGLWKEEEHYQASNGTVHKGKASKHTGHFVASCNGRTQEGTKCNDPVTCKRCK